MIIILITFSIILNLYKQWITSHWWTQERRGVTWLSTFHATINNRLSIHSPSKFQTGKHHINAHSTSVSPRPAASSTKITSFSRAKQGSGVHWDIVWSCMWSHIQWQVCLHSEQTEWKGHHESYTIPTHKLVNVKFGPAKENNDRVHESWRIFCRERLRVQVK